MPERGAFPTVSGDEYRRVITETDAPELASRELSGEILAFDARIIAGALEETLRAVMRAAALSDAVLQMRAVREGQPVVSDLRAVEGLARDLLHAGYRVRFGRSWTGGPSPDAAVCLGTGGEPGLETFLAEHPAWMVARPGR